MAIKGIYAAPGSAADGIYAYDETLTSKWSNEVMNTRTERLAIAPNNDIVALSSGAAQGLTRLTDDGSSATEVWNNTNLTGDYGLALDGPDGFYSASSDLIRFGLSNGQEVTTSPWPITKNGTGDHFVAVTSSLIVVAYRTNDPTLEAFNRSDGTSAWSISGTGRTILDVDYNGSTLVTLDSADDAVQIRSLADGTVSSETTNLGFTLSKLKILSDSRVLVGGFNGNIAFFDSSLTEQFSLSLADGSTVRSVDASAQEDVGVAMTEQTGLYKIDLAGGSVSQSVNTIASGSENTVGVAIATTSTQTSTFSGTIHDGNGDDITADTVELQQSSDGTVVDSQSNASGSYSLSASDSTSDLPKDYDVVVKDANYKNQTVANITVQDGTTSYTNNVTMPLPDGEPVTITTKTDSSVTVSWSNNNATWFSDVRIRDSNDNLVTEATSIPKADSQVQVSGLSAGTSYDASHRYTDTDDNSL
jgi:hypothetical protein